MVFRNDWCNNSKRGKENKLKAACDKIIIRSWFSERWSLFYQPDRGETNHWLSIQLEASTTHEEDPLEEPLTPTPRKRRERSVHWFPHILTWTEHVWSFGPAGWSRPDVGHMNLFSVSVEHVSPSNPDDLFRHDYESRENLLQPPAVWFQQADRAVCVSGKQFHITLPLHVITSSVLEEINQVTCAAMEVCSSVTCCSLQTYHHFSWWQGGNT